MDVGPLICRQSFCQCSGSAKVMTFFLAFHEKVNLSSNWQEGKENMQHALQEGYILYLPSDVFSMD